MSSALKLDIRPEHIAIVTIDQPDSRANVLSTPLWNELDGMVRSLRTLTELRGVLIRSGKPGVFVAGADLNELANASLDDPAPTRVLMELGLSVLARLEDLPFPTAALLDGYTLGGGLELALACDYRVAGSHPKITLGTPEITLGLIPGWGGTQRLPRLIGAHDGTQMILSNVQHDSHSAKDRNLVNLLTTSDDLIAAGVQLVSTDRGAWRAERERKQRPLSGDRMLGAQTFAAMREYVNTQMAGSLSRRASLEALDVIERGNRLPLVDGIKLETEAFLRLAGTPESRELIAAFFASRKK